MMSLEGFAETATQVAAVFGCVVAIVAVWRIPAVNGSIRWVGRRLVAEPLGGWAQKQVGTVVDARMGTLKEQSQESTRWLSEGQERIGREVVRLREEWADGHADHGQRLDQIDSRTRQLQPNGGKSIYDRLARIEVAQLTATAQGDRMEAVQASDRHGPGPFGPPPSGASLGKTDDEAVDPDEEDPSWPV